MIRASVRYDGGECEGFLMVTLAGARVLELFLPAKGIGKCNEKKDNMVEGERKKGGERDSDFFSSFFALLHEYLERCNYLVTEHHQCKNLQKKNPELVIFASLDVYRRAI